MRQAFYYILSQFTNFCHKTVAFRNNEILPLRKIKYVVWRYIHICSYFLKNGTKISHNIYIMKYIQREGMYYE